MKLTLRNPERCGVYHAYAEDGERVGFVWRYMGGPWSADAENRWAMAAGSWLPHDFTPRNSFPSRSEAASALAALYESTRQGE